MRETIEFRVPEELAQRYLPAESARRLGMGIARELRLEPSNPLLLEVRRIDEQLRARGLLRPRPILLLSPRALRAIEDGKLKGLAIEVARLS